MKTENNTGTKDPSAMGSMIELKPKEINLLEGEKTDLLFDKRALEAPDEALVAAIKANGWKGAVWVTEEKDAEGVLTGTYKIIAGRRRVKAAIQAGVKSIWANVVEPGISRHALVGLMITENEARKADTPVNKAVKLQRFIDLYLDQFRPGTAQVNEETGEMEYSEGWVPNRSLLKEARGKAGELLGVSERRVRQILAILDLSPKIQAAIENGKIDLAVAEPWVQLPKDKQESMFEKALEKAKKAPVLGGKAKKDKVTRGGAKKEDDWGGYKFNDLKTLIGDILERRDEFPKPVVSLAEIFAGQYEGPMTGWVKVLLAEVEPEEEGE